MLNICDVLVLFPRTACRNNLEIFRHYLLQEELVNRPFSAKKNWVCWWIRAFARTSWIKDMLEVGWNMVLSSIYDIFMPFTTYLIVKNYLYVKVPQIHLE